MPDQNKNDKPKPGEFYGRVRRLRAFLVDRRGQDLVEYALVLALIALGATASMSRLATSFSSAFSRVGSYVATYTT